MYEATGKTKFAEEASEEELRGRFEDSLVTFISAEAADEADVRAIAERGADETEDVARRLKAATTIPSGGGGQSQVALEQRRSVRGDG